MLLKLSRASSGGRLGGALLTGRGGDGGGTVARGLVPLSMPDLRLRGASSGAPSARIAEREASKVAAGTSSAPFASSIDEARGASAGRCATGGGGGVVRTRTAGGAGVPR